MSVKMKATAAACTVLFLAACETTTFISTWKNPQAAPLGKTKGRTVVACVMAQDEYIRHEAEDELVKIINKRGQKGVSSYTLLPPGVFDENIAKAAFEKAQAHGVVVIRPVSADKEVTATYTAGYWGGPYYGGFWGGYWGYGWGAVYDPGYLSVEKVVKIETLVYSLEQDKLVWAGLSRTVDPTQVDSFITEVGKACAEQMEKDGLIHS